tara:strand:+ start:484 stop:615 length:132 start_codon:yes stop_codon:yes gene_type:complete
MKLYAKQNGKTVSRSVSDNQVKAHLKRGWTVEEPKRKKFKAGK